MEANIVLLLAKNFLSMKILLKIFLKIVIIQLTHLQICTIISFLVFVYHFLPTILAPFPHCIICQT